MTNRSAGFHAPATSRKPWTIAVVFDRELRADDGTRPLIVRVDSCTQYPIDRQISVIPSCAKCGMLFMLIGRGGRQPFMYAQLISLCEPLVPFAVRRCEVLRGTESLGCHYVRSDQLQQFENARALARFPVRDGVDAQIDVHLDLRSLETEVEE
jgi:hypothetical protein